MQPPYVVGSPVAPDLIPADPTLPPSSRSRFWRLPVVFLVLVGLIALVLVMAPPEAAGPITGLAQLLSMAFCLVVTLRMTLRAASGRPRWAWGILALAQLSFVIGDVVIIVLASQPNISASTVSLADVFFLPLSPLTAIGAILFPAVQSSTARQVRVLLDVSIVVGALLGLALVFLIAPRVVSGTSTDLIFIAYPVADLTLLLTLLVLLVRGVQSAYRPVFFWLLIGFLCLIYADTSFNYLSLPGLHAGPSYQPGTPYVDPFWVAAAFAFSLAPLSFIRQRSTTTRWQWLERLTQRAAVFQPRRLLGQFFLLATPMLLLLVLLALVKAQPGQDGLTLALGVLTGLVMLLIIVRQLLTQSDLVDARTATERAEQLDRLKDQFITNVNHELRTPLNTLVGSLELLVMPNIEVPAQRRWDILQRSYRAGKQLIGMVEGVLDTRRIDQDASNFTPEVVHLATAAQAAITLIDPGEADPAARLIALQVPETLVVWGEAVRVQQILTNLLSNAIKYSPPRTPVTISATLVAEQTGRLAGKSGGRMVEIRVQDQGLGIPPEQQGFLFNRFVRLPRDLASTIRGNGLGLYLCRQFAEAMGGSISVVSTGVPGEGSTFHLRLPIPPPELRAVGQPSVLAGAADQ